MNCVHTHFDSLFHYEGRFGHIQSSLTQPLFTEVPVSSQESKRSYICQCFHFMPGTGAFHRLLL